MSLHQINHIVQLYATELPFLKAPALSLSYRVIFSVYLLGSYTVARFK